MTIALYMDEHIHKSITTGLRKRGIDVLTVQEDNHAGTSDQIILDRLIIYEFNPDWSGQVVAESVGSGWISLLIEQNNDEVLSGKRLQSDRRLLRNWSKGVNQEKLYLLLEPSIKVT